MMKIDVTMNKEEIDKFISELPGIIRNVAEETAKDTMKGAKKYYVDLVDKELRRIGHKHYQKESITKLNVEEPKRTLGGATDFVLSQKSRAGFMMEVDKKSVGGAVINGQHWLVKGMKGTAGERVNRYLEAIHKSAVMIDDNTITGKDPLKPLQKTFNEFVVPKYMKSIEKDMHDEIEKRLQNKIMPKNLME